MFVVSIQFNILLNYHHSAILMESSSVVLLYAGGKIFHCFSSILLYSKTVQGGDVVLIESWYVEYGTNRLFIFAHDRLECLVSCSAAGCSSLAT